jgi:hypothetical protein
VFRLPSLRFVQEPGDTARGRVDVAGAVTVTGSLMLAVYAIVNGNDTGWTSARTLGLLGGAVALAAAFLVVERRVVAPLVPLALFRIRSLATANGLGVLMAGGMFAYFFFSALYMQEILGYTPLEVGLAYLPSMVIWGAASLYSDRFVMRLGIVPPLVGGLALMAVGLALFARAPVDGDVMTDIIPASLAIGLGAGIAFNPILLAAMSGVGPAEFGLASGVVNTAFMMGGALGLAVLASVSTSRTDALADSEGHAAALNGGYHLAFLIGALFVVAAAVLGGLLLRGVSPAGAPEAAGPEGSPAVEA